MVIKLSRSIAGGPNNVLMQVQKGDEGAASRCSLIALLGRY
jgi:hypothetical protein